MINSPGFLAASTGNERFALDCYRRFIQMFSDIVLYVEFNRFEEMLNIKINIVYSMTTNYSPNTEEIIAGTKRLSSLGPE